MQQVTPPLTGGRFWPRVTLLGKFVSVQAVAQALTAISGLLLVRTLDKHQYALFTLANSMQATMNLLADTGLSMGLSAIGGRVWQDRHRFGQLVTTTMRLRRYLAMIAIAVVSPILVWMLVKNGSSLRYAALLTFTVLLGLGFQLTSDVLTIVPRLLSQIGRLQFLDLASALVRLAFIAVAYFVFLDALTAILATVVMAALQYSLLRRWATDGIDPKAPASEDDRRELLRIVKHGLPTTIYFCVQGQIVVWLLGILGGAQSVAEIGALGRLSVIFSIVASIMTTIVVPRFAKYQEPGLLKRRFLQIIGGFVLFGFGLVAFSALLPDVLLWFLGHGYSHLRNELPLMMIMIGLNSIAGAMWTLNSSKAWIEHSWLYIPTTLITQGILLLTMNVSVLRGAILFGIVSLFPTIVLNLGLAVRGWRAAARQAAHAQ
jgi:O-antigen/teichoic acid export membrane protein